jgi:hypothetical protein
LSLLGNKNLVTVGSTECVVNYEDSPLHIVNFLRKNGIKKFLDTFPVFVRRHLKYENLMQFTFKVIDFCCVTLKFVACLWLQ